MSDVSVTIDDLEMAFEWVSTDGMGNQAFVSKADGTIFYASEFEPLEETPDDVARVRAGSLGLRETGEMWEAARQLAP